MIFLLKYIELDAPARAEQDYCRNAQDRQAKQLFASRLTRTPGPQQYSGHQPVAMGVAAVDRIISA